MRDVAQAIHGAVLAGELGRRLEQDCEISDVTGNGGGGGGTFTVRVGGETYAVTIALRGRARRPPLRGEGGGGPPVPGLLGTEDLRPCF